MTGCEESPAGREAEGCASISAPGTESPQGIAAGG